MASVVIKPLKQLIQFLDWWAIEAPASFLVGTTNALMDFDEGLQLMANFRLWLAVEPMFGDYTWSGRTVGFFLRGLRLIMTLLVYLLIVVLGLGLIIGWWLLPLVLVGLRSNI